MVIVTGLGEEFSSFSTSPGQHLVATDGVDVMLFVLAELVIQQNEKEIVLKGWKNVPKLSDLSDYHLIEMFSSPSCLAADLVSCVHGPNSLVMRSI